MPLEIFARIFSWIALGFLAIAFLTAAYTGIFLLNSEAAEARVVEMRETVNSVPFTDPGAGKFYYPVLSFQAADGKEYRLQGSIPSMGKPDPGLAGGRHTVRYDKNNPAVARIDTFQELWAPSLLWLGLAALFGIFIAAIKNRPDKSSGAVSHDPLLK